MPEPSAPPRAPRAPRAARLRLALGAALTALAVGLFVAGTVDRAAGALVVAAAFVASLGLVHALGRAGPS